MKRSWLLVAALIIIIVQLLTVSGIESEQITKTLPPWKYSHPILYKDAAVTVTFAILGPPTITNDGGASGITDDSATLNGEITNTGNENPITIVYIGEMDGGTNPVLWSNNFTLGVKPLGIVSYTITDNLTPSKTYYYRYYCYNSVGSDWADSSANFTTYSGAYNPPTGLTITDLGGVQINISWIKEPTANNTMIRGSRSEYPAGITEFELWYFGQESTVNVTVGNLDFTRIRVSAFSELSGNYSPTYATAGIGGNFMDNLASAVEEMAASIYSIGDILTSIVFYIIVFGLLITMLIISFWKSDVFLDTGTGLMLIFCGLGWIDNLQEFSTVLIVFGCFKMFIAIYNVYASGKGSRGISQFKAWINRIKGGP